MNKINTLYRADRKIYDYEIKNGIKLLFRTNDGKPFKIYHLDGSYSMAYGYGEKSYTYNYDELVAKREEDKRIREENKRRKAIMEKLNQLSTEELERLFAER